MRAACQRAATTLHIRREPVCTVGVNVDQESIFFSAPPLCMAICWVLSLLRTPGATVHSTAHFPDAPVRFTIGHVVT